MAATTTRNSGHVTWGHFLSVMGLILIGLIALNSFVWAMHSREMVQFEKRLDTQVQNLTEKIDRCRVGLEKIDKKLEERK